MRQSMVDRLADRGPVFHDSERLGLSSRDAVRAAVGTDFCDGSNGSTIMNATRIAAVLKNGQPGQSLEVAGWVRTRRDSKQGFSFIELNDGSCMANLQIVVGSDVPGYESHIKEVTTGASLHVVGRAQGKSRQRPARRAGGQVAWKSWARPTPKPIRCRKSGTASSSCARSPTCVRGPTRSEPVARVRNAVCASIHNFFQSRGFLYIQTPIITTSDCEGAGAMFQVTTLDLAKLAHVRGQTARSPRSPARHRLLARFLRQAGLADGQRPARGGDLRHLAGRLLHVRADLPGRKLQHDAAPGRVLDDRAGDAFLRAADNMRLAEDFIRTLVRDVLAKVPRGHGLLQRADRADRPGQPAKTSPKTISSASPTPRRSTSCKQSGQTFEFPDRLGPRPAIRARAVSDRKALPASGDPLRLPAHDQAVLHAVQRRRQNGPRHGRARPARGRDHRRQPARRAARRARRAPAESATSIRTITGGTSTCAVTARSPTPASAWGWSGRFC